MLTRVAVVCGNGLSIDLTKSYARADLAAWDTQRPLSWPVPTPGKPDTPLLDSLPRLKAALEGPRFARATSDFDKFVAIAALSERARLDHAAGRRRSSTKNSADGALAFQVQVDRVDLGAWRWMEWLRRFRGNLDLVVSFNYDLVVERACEAGGHLVERIQAQQESGVPAARVFKPHGSVDFNVSRAALRVGFTYPFGDNWEVTDSDLPVELAPTADLLEPRFCADIVLPGERSALTRVQWVAPIYNQIRARLRHVDYCVLAGLSYWVPDRCEIDRIVDALPTDATVVVANPHPPPDLLRSLQDRERPVALWTAGPEPLPIIRSRPTLPG